MTLTQILKIIQKNIILLFGVPLALAIMVFWLTRNDPRTYESETTVYTGIGSGLSLEAIDQGRLDFHASKLAYDNIINVVRSRKTLEEVSLRLLAQNLSLEEHHPKFLSMESFAELQSLVPEDVREFVIENDPGNKNPEDIYERLVQYKNLSDTNFIYKLLSVSHPHYSIGSLQKITVKRVSNSDLISITYKTDDPGICRQTLVILNDVFVRNYKMLKENQSDIIVKYFEEEVRKANGRLQQAEDNLLDFNQKHNIINYYEQTKHISDQKEKLDTRLLDEKMVFSSADSVLRKLEIKLKQQKNISINNQEILNLRERLSDLTLRTTLMESSQEISDSLLADIATLKDSAEWVKRQIRSGLDTLFKYNYSVEGIPDQELFTNYLDNLITHEESKARLAALKQRQREFEETYRIFAPLGAILKRLEREIDVHEQEYLSLLYSLNQSKLKQQNLEFLSNMKVVDQPFYPLYPNASKRKILVAGAFAAGFIIILFLIVALEYLDTTIRTSARLEKITGLFVASIYPKFRKKDRKERLLSSMSLILSRHILTRSKERKAEPPLRIFLFSMESLEGKTTIGRGLKKQLQSTGKSVAYVNHNITDQNTEENDYGYQADEKFSNIGGIHELLPESQDQIKKYDFIIFELPALIGNPFPVNLISEGDIHLMVVRSNRRWREADQKTLDTYTRITDNDVWAVLNGTEEFVLETFMGELPAKRTFIRKLIKRWSGFRFFERSRI